MTINCLMWVMPLFISNIDDSNKAIKRKITENFWIKNHCNIIEYKIMEHINGDIENQFGFSYKFL